MCLDSITCDFFNFLGQFSNEAHRDFLHHETLSWLQQMDSDASFKFFFFFMRVQKMWKPRLDFM